MARKYLNILLTEIYLRHVSLQKQTQIFRFLDPSQGALPHCHESRETNLCTNAREILWSMSRREGIWNSKRASTIVAAVIAHQEFDSLVPEHKRLRATKTLFDLHRCQQKLRILTATMRAGDIGFVGASGGTFC